VNKGGTRENLVASHPGNVNAAKSGVYSSSGRVVSARAAEITDAIMRLPWANSIDAVGAAEIGSLVALIEACDADILVNGLTKRGEVRSILKMRDQLSRRLQGWTDRYAMNPRARIEMHSAITRGTVGSDFASRRDAQVSDESS
jgi:hypothetical protein